jgi:hypothetical protein
MAVSSTTSAVVQAVVNGDLPENDNPPLQNDSGEFTEVVLVPVDGLIPFLLGNDPTLRSSFFVLRSFFVLSLIVDVNGARREASGGGGHRRQDLAHRADSAQCPSLQVRPVSSRLDVSLLHLELSLLPGSCKLGNSPERSEKAQKKKKAQKKSIQKRKM